MSLGGFSDVKKATKEIQELCDLVKPYVEKETGKVYEEFEAIEYRNQIVNGENFLIKVHVGGESYVHLMVFLQVNEKSPELKGVQPNKKRDDPLIPF